MALGTLAIDTLQDGLGNSGSATNAIKGSAKAWVNFDGTLSGTIAPRSAFNVSSVTKNGTGDYTLNFATPMVDVNYAVVGAVQSNGVTSSVNLNLSGAPTSITSYRVITGGNSVSAGTFTMTNTPYIAIGILGN